MNFETWVDMVKKEFYTQPWIQKRIRNKDISKEEFEKYLQDEETKKTILSMYEDMVWEWERRKDELTSKGYNIEKYAKIKALAKGHCLYLMY